MQADFLAAMRKGVAADDTANANRAAVQEILTQVERDLGVFLGLPVQLTQVSRHAPSEEPMLLGTRHVLERPVRRYQALAVKCGDKTYDLCEWEEGALVFPVTLRFAKQTEVAVDAVSLAAAISDLLATPTVGRTLKQLRASPP